MLETFAGFSLEESIVSLRRLTMLLWSSVLALPVAACGQAGQLQEVLRAVRTEAGAPGALLGLRFPDGETLTLASGVADLESGRPMRPDEDRKSVV